MWTKQSVLVSQLAVPITTTAFTQCETSMLRITPLFSVSVQSVLLWVTCQLCEPVKKLPKCRYFRDITWTLTSGADNVTEQTVHCHCPRGAVAYLIKRQAVQAPHGLLGYRYSFACSPQSVSTVTCPLYSSQQHLGFLFSHATMFVLTVTVLVCRKDMGNGSNHSFHSSYRFSFFCLHTEV